MVEENIWADSTAGHDVDENNDCPVLAKFPSTLKPICLTVISYTHQWSMVLPKGFYVL